MATKKTTNKKAAKSEKASTGYEGTEKVSTGYEGTGEKSPKGK